MFENDKLKNRLLDAGRGKVTYALYKKDGNVYEVPKQVAFEMLTNDWYTNFSVDDIRMEPKQMNEIHEKLPGISEDAIRAIMNVNILGGVVNIIYRDEVNIERLRKLDRLHKFLDLRLNEHRFFGLF